MDPQLLHTVTELLGGDWTRTVSAVSDSLHSDIALLNDVNSAVLSHRGKMLRPMCALLVAKALGGCTDDTIRFAAAAELLHNATLIHDDVADSSDTRRGHPTVSSIIGPNAAVLVGDFWLSKAVAQVSGTRHMTEVMDCFAGTLSSLAEGEMLQLEKSLSLDTTEEDYYRIIYCKTASLFECTCLAAAVSVDATPEQRKAASAYAAALGTAFQIKDDIFDYEEASEIGKPVGIDLRERKMTLPLLGALDGSPRAGEIISMMRDLDTHPENLAQIRSFVLEGDGIGYATRQLNAWIDKACAALDSFPDCREKECLKEIARFNTIRKI